MGYGYNPASQIVTRTTDNDLLTVAVAPNQDRTYTVNGLNQYTAAGVMIGYNSKGSTTQVGSKTYEYNPLDQLVRTGGVNGTSFYHDALGRIDYLETAGVNVSGEADSSFPELLEVVVPAITIGQKCQKMAVTGRS